MLFHPTEICFLKNDISIQYINLLETIFKSMCPTSLGGGEGQNTYTHKKKLNVDLLQIYITPLNFGDNGKFYAIYLFIDRELHDVNGSCSV
jgi:hypothetical protein